MSKNQSPYLILNLTIPELLKQEFTIELSMGADNQIYVNASNGWDEVFEANGKTIAEAVTKLSEKIEGDKECSKQTNNEYREN